MQETHFKISVSKHTLYMASCVSLGALLMTTALAAADGSRATQTVIGSDIIVPYDGYLRVDEQPLTGVREITFELHDADSGGNLIWSETQAVNVYNGRFSVGLGSSVKIDDAILDGEKIWLGMKILETDAQGNQTEVALAGRQALSPGAYAAVTRYTNRLDVLTDLEVGRSVDVGEKNAIDYNETTDTLTLSANKAFGGGVRVESDFVSEGDTRLGATDYSSTTTFYTGESRPNDFAFFRIYGSSGEYLAIDNNEIDATDTLFLQRYSGNGVEIGGNFVVESSSTLGEDPGDTTTFSGAKGSLLTINADGSTMTMDGESLDGSGRLHLQRNLGSETVFGGDLEITGSLLDFEVTGPYSITSFGNNTPNQATVTGTLVPSYDSSGVGNSVCFLSKQQSYNHELGTDFHCDINRGSSDWSMSAKVIGDINTRLVCEAHCLTW